jgi:hypothetical protein
MMLSRLKRFYQSHYNSKLPDASFVEVETVE